MKTTITVTVESDQQPSPVVTRRGMAVDLDADFKHYVDMVKSIAAANVLGMVERALNEHEAACAAATVKQLSAGIEHESKVRENVSQVQPQPAAGPVPEVGTTVPAVPATQAVGVASGPA